MAIVRGVNEKRDGTGLEAKEQARRDFVSSAQELTLKSCEKPLSDLGRIVIDSKYVF